MSDLDLTDDYIDVRDIIARFEDLRVNSGTAIDEMAELADLTTILSDLRDVGAGDHQWEGDWYPVTLIRDSHFRDYVQEFAIECDMLPKVNATRWPYPTVTADWDRAARELQMDYTSVEIDGVTYWTR